MPLDPKTQQVVNFFTSDLFDLVFPYAGTSAVITFDDQPFFTYYDFIQALDVIYTNPQYTSLSGFGLTGPSNSLTINKYEIAAFLANVSVETGDPALQLPFMTSGPIPGLTLAGGLTSSIEGFPVAAYPASQSYIPSYVNAPMFSSPPQLSFYNNYDSTSSNQPPPVIPIYGTSAAPVVPATIYQNAIFTLYDNAGAGFGSDQQVMAAVADDSTLWYQPQVLGTDNNAFPYETFTNGAPVGPNPRGTIGPYPYSNNSAYLSNRSYVGMGPYCSYGGKGVIQLTANYNYVLPSLALFNDLRLIQYPNLLVTTDRVNFNSSTKFQFLPSNTPVSYVFGFPGPNTNGNNVPPLDILNTTPPARQLSWLTSLYFWMIIESGLGMTAHQAMLDPTTWGITKANYIVNTPGGSGCPGSLPAAVEKIEYYKQLCALFGISQIDIDLSIVCPMP